MKVKPLGLIAGLLVCLLAIAAAWWLLHTAPTTGTQEKKRAPKIVQTTNIEPRDQTVAVSAYGTVVPARRLVVRPEITGRIISQHAALIPGGRIGENETLFTIDDADYQIALREAQATLAEAESESSLEAGRQTVARAEWEQLQRDLPEAEINRSLVLREPFKLQVEARLERAEAAVARADLDLTRAAVAAPFNALVIDESVEIGQLADSGTPLATLVGADAFWVQANIPRDELRWIRLPQGDAPGAAATIRLSSAGGNSPTWEGRVVRLLGDLEEAGRLARVLIEVPNPLDSNPDQPLLIGSYVRVEIQAGTLKSVLEIPRTALREGDRVWLVGPDHQLIIRDADVLWRQETTVLLNAEVAPDEALIVSDLGAPLPGMQLDPQPAVHPPER